MEFTKKIEIKLWNEGKKSLFASHFKVGHANYDMYGKYWKVYEDVNFKKFWARGVE